MLVTYIGNIWLTQEGFKGKAQHLRKSTLLRVHSVTGQNVLSVFTINFGDMGFVHFWHCGVREIERIRLL